MPSSRAERTAAASVLDSVLRLEPGLPGPEIPSPSGFPNWTLRSVSFRAAWFMMTSSWFVSPSMTAPSVTTASTSLRSIRACTAIGMS